MSRVEPVALAPATIPCAGCGKAFPLAWRNGEPKRYCSPACRRPAPKLARELVIRDCVICGEHFTVGRSRVTCGRPECQRGLARAKERNRDHVKRAAVSDVTAKQEAEMRRKARNCPLCRVRMTSKPHLPNSKELDHILPIVMGGTHTFGNVRIVCRSCNQRRPKDGSDYTGQLTLWAQGPVPVGRPDGRRNGKNANRGTCRSGLHLWAPENIVTTTAGKKLCRLCRIATERRNSRVRPPQQCACGAMFAAPGRTAMCPDCIAATAKRAAELHAAGGVTWAEVAAKVGYQSAEGARFAAKRIGYVPERSAAALPRPPKLCQCGSLIPSGNRGANWARCDDCVRSEAERAAYLRTEQGWTLRMIANELGYSSQSTVTSLLKTVRLAGTGLDQPRRAAA
jgi:5-methylcytosine-specific restriction endonuclease McrA